METEKLDIEVNFTGDLGNHMDAIKIISGAYSDMKDHYRKRYESDHRKRLWDFAMASGIPEDSIPYPTEEIEKAAETSARHALIRAIKSQID